MGMSTDRAATLNVRPETIADLKGHPANYQVHGEGQLSELVRSIRRHGAYKNAVVSADGYILAGHGILEAARREGYKQWPCERRDYNHDHPDALNLLLTDNEIGNPANPLGPDPDQTLLAALARQVNEATGLEGTGLDEGLLAALIAERAEPLVAPGQVSSSPSNMWTGAVGQGAGSKRALEWGEILVFLEENLYERCKQKLDGQVELGGSYQDEMRSLFNGYLDAH